MIIPLQPIKPFICLQIEPQRKSRLYGANKERKTPHDGGAIYAIGTILVNKLESFNFVINSSALS